VSETKKDSMGYAQISDSIGPVSSIILDRADSVLEEWHGLI